MGRSIVFYFNTVIFFVGVLLLATAVSNAVSQDLSLITFAELISGVLLMVIGSRAIRRIQ